MRGRRGGGGGGEIFRVAMICIPDLFVLRLLVLPNSTNKIYHVLSMNDESLKSKNHLYIKIDQNNKKVIFLKINNFFQH